MTVFNLYVSGILYGKLELDPAAPRVRRLDVFTGTLGDWEPITPEISGEWQKKAPAAPGSRGGGQPKYFSRKGTLST